MHKNRRIRNMAKVEQIDFQGIFERAAGHEAQLETRTVVSTSMIDNKNTFSGEPKPGSIIITAARRREQLFV
jgi:hypothetical protein